MNKQRKLAEAWHHLREALQSLDDSGVDSKAIVHIQWAIDLVDEELKTRSEHLTIAQ